MGNPSIKTDRQSVESLITWQCSKDTPDVAAMLLALLAEQEAAEKERDTNIFIANDLIKKLAAAEAARDASQVDAERYAWIRSNYDVSAARLGYHDLLALRAPFVAYPSTETTMDLFIDSARKETGNG